MGFRKVRYWDQLYLLFSFIILEDGHGTKSKFVKFADDATFLAQAVHNVEGRDSLREDLKILFKWSEKWQKNFNLEKCKIMHVWNKTNLLDKYSLGGKILGPVMEVDEESDLRVRREVPDRWNTAAIRQRNWR